MRGRWREVGIQVPEETRDGFAEEDILNKDLKHGTGFGIRQIWVQNLVTFYL